MFGPRSKRIFNRILPFGLIWLFTGWVFLFVEAAVTRNFRDQPDSAIRVDKEIFILASVAVFVFGMLTGLAETLFLGKLFRHRRFLARIIYKLFSYLFIFLLIGLLTFPFAAALELDRPVMSREVWNKYADFFPSITHLSTLLQMSFSLLLSLFYAEIRDYIGSRALLHFFTGRYHHPVEEERVFMFLDMKSSTRYAEQLGHTRYFRMLREYYADITGPIIRYAGEVYQYVGDEIIVSWPLEKGTRDAACLRCFFVMREALEKQAKKYMRQYGLMPSFKAGIHAGRVTTGEIGEIKKEILFTGDVLNSTARIQSLCNQYDASLLISGELFRQLQLPADQFNVMALGEAELRGRDESMELYWVEKAPAGGKN